MTLSLLTINRPLKALPIILIFIWFLSIINCSRSQLISSLSIEWQPIDSLNTSLPPGIQVYEGQNSDLPLKAWYVRIDEADTNITTRVVYSDEVDRRETVSSFAQDLGACVVTNGGYFRMDLTPTKHVGLLFVDENIIQTAIQFIVRMGILYPTARSTIGFTEKGDIDIAWVSSHHDSLFEWKIPPINKPNKPAPPLDFMNAQYWPVRDALSAGPTLVSDSKINITVNEELFFGTTIPKVHPRTAAGYTGEGNLILLVVDGRQSESRGVNLHELATLMQDLGCVEALNLDGGGSSTLVVNGTLLNRPAGGMMEREVMSALAVFYTGDQWK